MRLVNSHSHIELSTDDCVSVSGVSFLQECNNTENALIPTIANAIKFFFILLYYRLLNY